ncbi:MAG: hypothetical protein IT321_10980 [Anaerolineae bacterium]|nr:hypothetical protein [Anaerolineae bacterium]
MAFAFALSAASSPVSAMYTPAAVLRELPAGVAPFQRIQPDLPPPQNVTSANARELPACHFSGIL